MSTYDKNSHNETCQKRKNIDSRKTVLIGILQYGIMSRCQQNKNNGAYSNQVQLDNSNEYQLT